MSDAEVLLRLVLEATGPVTITDEQIVRGGERFRVVVESDPVNMTRTVKVVTLG